MLLLIICEVHTGKYSDRSFEVRAERTKNKIRIFFCMDRTNWPIRDLLYSHSQTAKTKGFPKFRTEHICVFLECSCWKEFFFNSPNLFPVPLTFFQFLYLICIGFHSKSQNLRRNFCCPFCSISRSKTPFWRPSTALD